MIHNEGRGGGGEPAHAEPPRARNSHCCGHRHSLAQHRSYHQCFQGICYRLSAMNTEQLKARPSEFKQFAKKTLFPKGPPPLAETLLVESQKFKCFSGKSCQNFDLRQNARGAAASGICNCSHIPTRLYININGRKSGHIKSFRFSKRKKIYFCWSNRKLELVAAFQGAVTIVRVIFSLRPRRPPAPQHF